MQQNKKEHNTLHLVERISLNDIQNLEGIREDDYF